MIEEIFTPTIIPCPICKNPIEVDEWNIVLTKEKFTPLDYERMRLRFLLQERMGALITELKEEKKIGSIKTDSIPNKKDRIDEYKLMLKAIPLSEAIPEEV